MRKISTILCAIICTTLLSSTMTVAAKAERLEISYDNNIKFVQDLRNIADEYISNNPNYADVIEQEFELYSQDEMLMDFYCDSKNEATNIFETALKISIRNAPQEIVGVYSMKPTGSDSLFYCNVDTTIKQEEPTWCGVGATLMALTGIKNNSSSDLKTGFKLPSQSDIANAVCRDKNGNQYKYGTAWVAYVVSYLNSQIKPSAYKYTCKEITNDISPEDVGSYIRNSLYVNRPVLLHARPYQAFDYYSGRTWTDGHYVVVDQCYLHDDIYRIVDPSYLSDPSGNPYQGVHYVTLDEIYNSLYCPENEVTGRFLIYG